jgi:hypothetical protein
MNCIRVSRSRWLARLVFFLALFFTGIRCSEVGQPARPSQAAECEKLFVDSGGALAQNQIHQNRQIKLPGRFNG